MSQLADLKAQGIDGIIKEDNEVAGDVEHASGLDAALIAAAQAVSTARSRATAP